MTVGSDLSGAVVLVVHAQPDDEVFATGAATIAANEARDRVHRRIFTGGEGRARGTSLPTLRRHGVARKLGSPCRPGCWASTPGRT
jgi:LmbE family N-acetylglucosaminyl deacetylase